MYSRTFGYVYARAQTRIPRAYCTTVRVYGARRLPRIYSQCTLFPAGQTSLRSHCCISGFSPSFPTRIARLFNKRVSNDRRCRCTRCFWWRRGGGGALIEHVHVASSVFARVSGAGIQGLAGKAVGLAGPAHQTTTRCTFLSRYTHPSNVWFSFVDRDISRRRLFRNGRITIIIRTLLARSPPICAAHEIPSPVRPTQTSSYTAARMFK